MKKVLLALGLLVVGLGSCIKETPAPVLTKAQMKQKVDSVVAERVKELEVMSRRDLQDRLKIEGKIKVDSILNARMNPPHKDSAKKSAPSPIKK